MRKQSISSPGDAFDLRRKFVKVIGINTRGFVEFEFSVGAPELCVELMLPQPAFEEFCVAQNVSRLDGADSARETQTLDGQ